MEETNKNTSAPVTDRTRATATPETTLSITVDDGSLRVPIRNKQQEEIGVFYFRPTDLNMVSRFNTMVSRLDEVTSLLDGIQTSDLSDPDAMQTLETAKERLFELCDYTFGGNMSEAFFGSMNPFSPVGGRLYFESAIKSLGDFISGQFKQATKDVTRANRHKPSDHLNKGGKRRRR